MLPCFCSISSFHMSADDPKGAKLACYWQQDTDECCSQQVSGLGHRQAPQIPLGTVKLDRVPQKVKPILAGTFSKLYGFLGD